MSSGTIPSLSYSPRITEWTAAAGGSAVRGAEAEAPANLTRQKSTDTSTDTVRTQPKLKAIDTPKRPCI